MIKLRNLICEIIAEKMSYKQLMTNSDPDRKDRANRIPARSLVAKSVNDREAWKFSYKTPRDENTTGLRHQGFIYFFKESMEPGDDAMDIPCSVDCSCPDYKFRFSYANKQQDAGENGPNSLNKGLNYPSSINRGPGLCKHLISLKAYLQTEIKGEPVGPEEPVSSIEPRAIPRSPTPKEIPPEEPEPEVPIDPTQTPKEPEQGEEPTEPINKTNQTPQGPEEVPKIEEPEPPEEEKPEKNKLKETLSSYQHISKKLDEICRTHPVFTINY